jgi:hypothetical protein
LPLIQVIKLPLGLFNCNRWVNTYVYRSLKVRHHSGGQAFVGPQSCYCEWLKFSQDLFLPLWPQTDFCGRPICQHILGFSITDQREVKTQIFWAVSDSIALGICLRVWTGTRIVMSQESLSRTDFILSREVWYS